MPEKFFQSRTLLVKRIGHATHWVCSSDCRTVSWAVIENLSWPCPCRVDGICWLDQSVSRSYGWKEHLDTLEHCHAVSRPSKYYAWQTNAIAQSCITEGFARPTVMVEEFFQLTKSLCVRHHLLGTEVSLMMITLSQPRCCWNKVFALLFQACVSFWNAFAQGALELVHLWGQPVPRRFDALLLVLLNFVKIYLILFQLIIFTSK